MTDPTENHVGAVRRCGEMMMMRFVERVPWYLAEYYMFHDFRCEGC